MFISPKTTREQRKLRYFCNYILLIRSASLWASSWARLRAVRPVLLVLVAALSLVLPQAASAHPAPFSYLDVEYHEDAIEGTATLHVIDLAHDLQVDLPDGPIDSHILHHIAERKEDIGALLSDRIVMRGSDGARLMPDWQSVTVVADDDALRVGYRIEGAPPAELSVQALLFPYDRVHQTFTNVYEGGELRQQWIFGEGSSAQTYFQGSVAGVLSVLGTFIPSGIHHIAIGPDHILFVIGLILLGGTWRRLALIVTSFTIGHSITLALAALNILVIPASIIEPAIALSIVIIGVDNLMRGDGKDLRPYLAFAFGLIHGFGFAYVLREFGLPDANLAFALLGFNLGVEIGQIVIVLIAGGAMVMLAKANAKAAKWVQIAGSLAVALAGAYWFVDRVFFSGAG